MEITNPSADELEDVLRLAFRHLPPRELSLRVASLLDAFPPGTTTCDGVFQAKENGVPVGALFSQQRPDGSVLIWAPTMTDGRSTAPFFEPLERFCLKCHAVASIALADFRQPIDEKTLLSVGRYEYLSELIYLATTITEDATREPSERLSFVPIDEVPDADEKLERLVRRTYRNSSDFPRLMNVVPVDKVLDGYRSGGLFLPELWFFVREAEQDLGVLLLTDHPDDQIELTYMGLVEEARGRGLAREIVRQARRMAFRRRRSILLTAVDERNTAALKAYLAQNFRAWDRKRVYARFFAGSGD